MIRDTFTNQPRQKAICMNFILDIFCQRIKFRVMAFLRYRFSIRGCIINHLGTGVAVNDVLLISPNDRNNIAKLHFLFHLMYRLKFMRVVIMRENPSTHHINKIFELAHRSKLGSHPSDIHLSNTGYKIEIYFGVRYVRRCKNNSRTVFTLHYQVDNFIVKSTSSTPGRDFMSLVNKKELQSQCRHRV